MGIDQHLEVDYAHNEDKGLRIHLFIECYSECGRVKSSALKKVRL